MQIEEVPAFSSSTNQALDDLVKQFALEEALEVKKVRDMQHLLAEAHRALADHHPDQYVHGGKDCMSSVWCGTETL